MGLHLTLVIVLPGRTKRIWAFIPSRGGARFQPPCGDQGADTDARENGSLTGHRLDQPVRLEGGVTDPIFAIEFKGRGVQALSFILG
jgi:hypothetical protein